MKFKKGQMVYVQGRWKCRVIEDHGTSISYAAIEGGTPSSEGKTLQAAKDLFSPTRLTASEWDKLAIPLGPGTQENPGD